MRSKGGKLMIAWLVQKTTGFVKIVQGLITSLIKLPDESNFAIQRADGEGNILKVVPNSNVGYDDVTIHGNIEIGWLDKTWFSQLKQSCGGETEANYDGCNTLFSSSGTRYLDLKQFLTRPAYTELKMEASYSSYLNLTNHFNSLDENKISMQVNSDSLNVSLIQKDSAKDVWLSSDFYTYTDTGIYWSWSRKPASLDMFETFSNFNTLLWIRGLLKNSDDYTVKNYVLGLVSLLIESATNWVQINTGLKVPLIRPDSDTGTLKIQNLDGTNDIITVTPSTTGEYDKIDMRGDIEIGNTENTNYSKMRQSCGEDFSVNTWGGYNELYSSYGSRYLKLYNYGGSLSYGGFADLYVEGNGFGYLQIEAKNSGGNGFARIQARSNLAELYLKNYTADNAKGSMLYAGILQDHAYINHQRETIGMEFYEDYTNAGSVLWEYGLFANSNDYVFKNYLLSLTSFLIESATNFVKFITGIKLPLIRPIEDGTSAIKIQNVDGSADVVTIDTTNSKVTAPRLVGSTKVVTPVVAPVTDGTEALKVQNAAGTTDVMTVDTTNNKTTFSGSVVLSLAEYVDDTAAAAGGVPVGGLYRTGSVVKIRVSERADRHG
jgi:hypothetical protein